MLLRNSALFFLARGVPGLVNFVLLAAYTRLLSPSEFGVYALLVAGVNLFYSLAFHWIGQAQLRFLPRAVELPDKVQAAGLHAFLLSAVLCGFIGGGIFMAGADAAWQAALPVAVVLLWARSWFELNLDLATSRGKPGRYATLSSVRAAVALAAGTTLVALGYGAVGALLGLLVGFVAAGVGLTWRDWTRVGLAKLDVPLIGRLAAYAYPLSVAAGLGFFVGTSDRFLLAYFMGEAAAGTYAAAFDLVFFGLGMLYLAVHLAAYPLATAAFERLGPEAAVSQLRQNGTLLLTVGVPSTVAVALYAENITHVILGAEFRGPAALLVPWVAVAILLAAIRAYHFDVGFQLARRTARQIGIALTAAVCNIVLNIMLIPGLGLLGCVYATVGSFALALALSVWLGFRCFPMPLLSQPLLRAVAISAPVALTCVAMAEGRGPVALLLQGLAAGSVWLLCVWFGDIAGARALTAKTFAAFGPHHRRP